MMGIPLEVWSVITVTFGYLIGGVFQPWFVERQRREADLRDRRREQLSTSMETLRHVFGVANEWSHYVQRRIGEEGLSAAQEIEKDLDRDQRWQAALLDEDLAQARLHDKGDRTVAKRAVARASVVVATARSASGADALQEASVESQKVFREALQHLGKKYREL